MIDTSSVQELVPMYPWPTPTLPSLTEDSVPLDEEMIKVPLPVMMSSMPSVSSQPPNDEAFKKRKANEDLTPQIEVMDLDDFEFDKVVLMNMMVLNTPMTYFE